MEIMKLKEMAIKPVGSLKSIKPEPIRTKKSSPVKKSYPVPPPSFYNLDEIKTKLDVDTQELKQKKQSVQSELVMIKQLLRNIQKNKLNIIRDYYENDKLSMQRKMAIKSIKSKVEE
jgi:hypothetical protein